MNIQLTYRLSAFCVATGLTALSSIRKAFANGDHFDSDGGIGRVSESLTKNAEGLPTLIAAVSYIMGIGFTIAGLLKLKDYVDDPSRAPMKDALIRLGVGVGLIFLPWFIEIISGSMGADGGQEVKVPKLNRFN